jgi:hypothetical protein
MAAHSLAKAVVKQVIDQVWIEEILKCICDIVLLEQFTLFLWLSYKSVTKLLKKKIGENK